MTLDTLLELEAAADLRYSEDQTVENLKRLKAANQLVREHPDYERRRENAATEAVIRYARGQ